MSYTTTLFSNSESMLLPKQTTHTTHYSISQLFPLILTWGGFKKHVQTLAFKIAFYLILLIHRMHCNVQLLHIPKQKLVGILLLLYFETSGSYLQSIYSLVCIKYIYTKLFSWFSIVRDEQKFFIRNTRDKDNISIFLQNKWFFF